MKKWTCTKCGEVEPKVIYYSCPAQADCPNCGERLEDPDGGIKILSLEESIVARPSLYTDEFLEKGTHRLTPELIKEIKEIKIKLGIK